jgi:hypothetical protein
MPGNPKAKPRHKDTAALRLYAGRPWITWLHDTARAERISVAGLVDRVMAEYAARRGLPPSPPRFERDRGPEQKMRPER